LETEARKVFGDAGFDGDILEEATTNFLEMAQVFRQMGGNK
jgi:hypothetical protein